MKYSVFVFLFICLACTPQKSVNKPKLVVVISIDQMRGDYYDLLIKPSNFQGGFERLYSQGNVYNETHHRHAVTTTAAGHATLATGFVPRNNGIVNNTVYNRALGFSHYCIWDTTVLYVGIDSCDLNLVSADNLKKPTLGDYVKQADKQSKSYSIALKDRASILMGGKNANRAFWFDAKSTQMVSTDYYAESFPTWAKNFKANQRFAQALVYGWNYEEKPTPQFTHPNDSFEQECGTFHPWFPHSVSSMDTQRVRENQEGAFMWNTPYGDAFVLDFAQELIAQEKLGTDEHTDILTVGLSAADIIGHQFGPNSKEVLDYYDKLDDFLEEFIVSLEKSIGRENLLIVLTADHGVAPLPEVLAERGQDAQRISKTQYDLDISQIDSQLMLEYGVDEHTILRANYNGAEPNFPYLNVQGIDSIDFVNSLMNKLEALPYIDQCYSFFDYSDESCNKPFIDLMRNSHRPEYEYFVKILGKPHYLVDMRSCGTTHGTPYGYDTHVPLVFYGGALSSKWNSDSTYTVDIVPTVLDYLNQEAKANFDGQVLDLE